MKKIMCIIITAIVAVTTFGSASVKAQAERRFDIAALVEDAKYLESHAYCDGIGTFYDFPDGETIWIHLKKSEASETGIRIELPGWDCHNTWHARPECGLFFAEENDAWRGC